MNTQPTAATTTYDEHYIESLKSSLLFLYKEMRALKLKTILDVFCHRDEGAVIPKSLIWIMNGALGKPFLSVSKSYNEFLRTLDSDIKEEYPSKKELKQIREKIVLNSKLNQFCKKVIPDEINF